MGWKNVFHCEINPFARRVLRYYWPNSFSYGDIRETEFSEWKGEIDILSGSLPCQPFSVAGRRAGKKDDRYLWPVMLRAVEEIRPRWLCSENVTGILSMVQSTVTATKVGKQATFLGKACDEIIEEKQEYITETIGKDLECIGYSVQVMVIPACAVGAPHRRDRVWFIGRQNKEDFLSRKDRRKAKEGKCAGRYGIGKQTFEGPDAADSPGESRRRELFERPGQGQSGGCHSQFGIDRAWREFPTQHPICSGIDGLPFELAGITFSRWRSETIAAYGNTIVPQVAREIFRSIQLVENEKPACKI